MGQKDIIKIGKIIDLDFTVLGFIDPGITVNIIRNGKLFKRDRITLPEKLVNILKCKNPRCITSVEKEIDQIFRLTDSKTRTYRCIYCDSKAN